MNPWHNSSHCYGGDMVACSKNGPWKLCFPIRDNSTVKEIIDIFSRYGTVANVSFTSTEGFVYFTTKESALKAYVDLKQDLDVRLPGEYNAEKLLDYNSAMGIPDGYTDNHHQHVKSRNNDGRYRNSHEDTGSSCDAIPSSHTRMPPGGSGKQESCGTHQIAAPHITTTNLTAQRSSYSSDDDKNNTNSKYRNPKQKPVTRDFQGLKEAGQNQNIPRSVQGPDDPLSNFYICKFTYKSMDFRSVEHAYQWKKASFLSFPELAKKIQSAKTAKEAKQLAYSIKFSKEWNLYKISFLKKLLILKWEQVPTFREELIACTDRKIIHPISNSYWGTGQSRNGSPGKNIFGHLLEDVLKEITAKHYPEKEKLSECGIDDESVGMMESSDRRESSNQDHQGAALDVVEDPEKQHSTQQLFSTDEKKDDDKKSESNKSCDKKRDEVNPHLEIVDDMASDASTRDLLWKTGILAGGTDAHTKSRGRDIFGCYSDGDENCGVHLLPAGCTGLPPGDGCHNQGEKYSRATSVVTHQGAAQYSPAESSRRQNSQRLSYKRDDNELYNEKCNDKKGDNNNSGHVPRVKDTEEVPSDSSNEDKTVKRIDFNGRPDDHANLLHGKIPSSGSCCEEGTNFSRKSSDGTDEKHPNKQQITQLLSSNDPSQKKDVSNSSSVGHIKTIGRGIIRCEMNQPYFPQVGHGGVPRNHDQELLYTSTGYHRTHQSAVPIVIDVPCLENSDSMVTDRCNEDASKRKQPPERSMGDHSKYHDTKTSSGVRHDKQESSSSSTGSYGIRRCGAAPTPTEHPGERQNIRRPSRIHDRPRDDDKDSQKKKYLDENNSSHAMAVDTKIPFDDARGEQETVNNRIFSQKIHQRAAHDVVKQSTGQISCHGADKEEDDDDGGEEYKKNNNKRNKEMPPLEDCDDPAPHFDTSDKGKSANTMGYHDNVSVRPKVPPSGARYHKEESRTQNSSSDMIQDTTTRDLRMKHTWPQQMRQSSYSRANIRNNHSQYLDDNDSDGIPVLGDDQGHAGRQHPYRTGEHSGYNVQKEYSHRRHNDQEYEHDNDDRELDTFELCVRNFPYSTIIKDLLKPFRLFGARGIKIINNEPGQSSLAFAQFMDYESAVEAYTTLDGTDFNGRALRINFARNTFCPEVIVQEKLKTSTIKVNVRGFND